jgi:hypothetical protein
MAARSPPPHRTILAARRVIVGRLGRALECATVVQKNTGGPEQFELAGSGARQPLDAYLCPSNEMPDKFLFTG